MNKNILCYILGFVLISGCGSIDTYQKMFKTQPMEKLPYKATLKVNKNSDSFIVKVKNEQQKLNDVRESVRFEATKYCLIKYGNSNVDWSMDEKNDDCINKKHNEIRNYQCYETACDRFGRHYQAFDSERKETGCVQE